jgi:hypothetical protein
LDRGPDFLRLANALSALYPREGEEKRLFGRNATGGRAVRGRKEIIWRDGSLGVWVVKKQ